MRAELPTIASCPHCGTILLRTPRVLVHPMSGERERIRRALGLFWFEHSRTRFDGRLHRCPGRERATATPVESEEPAARADRGGRWTTCLLVAAAAGLLAPASASAKDEFDRWPVGRVEQLHGVEYPRGVGLPFPVGDLSALFGDRVERRRGFGSQQVRVRRLEVAGETGPVSEMPGARKTAESWRGLELASGRYQVVDTLREDAAGVVYLAHDRNLDSHVDVEVPSLSQGEVEGSTVHFVREVRSLARLGHPHLVKVTEVGTYHEAPFVVAEHLAGGSLKFRRPVGPDGRPAPVAPETLGDWLLEIASALDYLHSQGRVYREVSPASIRFDAQGRAYLGGLAMSEAVAERMDAAPVGAATEAPASGEPGARLAPEVLEGEKPDGLSDQYALAATVHELLGLGAEDAGQPAASELPDPQGPGVADSPSLSAAVRRGLSREPRDRYPSCVAFAQAVLAGARMTAPGGHGGRILQATAAAGLPARGVGRRSAGPLEPDRGSSGGYFVVALACSTLVAVAGIRARRATRRAPVPSDHAAPREADREPLRELASPIAGPPAACVPDERGRQLATVERRSQPRGRVGASPLHAIANSLFRRHELAPPTGRPRVHLGHNLLPVPYLSPASGPPAPGRRAAATELGRVASRRAS